MNIKRKELLKSLETAMPFISQFSYVDVLGCFCFSDKKLRAIGKGTEVILDFPYDLECCIPAELFFKLIQLLKEGDIELNVEGVSLIVEVKGSTQGKFKCFPMTDFPTYNPLKQEDGFKNLPDDFMPGLKRTMNTVCKDETRVDIGGVLVVKDIMYSTDKYRISQYKMKEGLEDSFFIPLDGVKCITSIDRKIEGYALDSNSLLLKIAGGYVRVKLGENKFPDVETYFSFDADKLIRFPVGIKESIMRVALIKDEDTIVEADRIIRMVSDGKELRLDSVAGVPVTISDRLPIKDDGFPSFNVCINPVFLLECLGSEKQAFKVLEDDLLIQFADNGHKLSMALSDVPVTPNE